MSLSIRAIGMDPGIRNYAVSVLDVKFTNRRRTNKKRWESDGVAVQVIKSGLLKNPMNDVNLNVVAQARAFEEEVRRILLKYKPDIVCAERFQNRGFRAGGGQMEAVNLMLGVLSSMPEFDDIQLKLVSPMVWKSAIKKQMDLEAAYKRCEFPVHELDGALIGVYGSYVVTEQTPFSCGEFNELRFVESLQGNIAKVTLSALKVKKGSGKKQRKRRK